MQLSGPLHQVSDAAVRPTDPVHRVSEVAVRPIDPVHWVSDMAVRPTDPVQQVSDVAVSSHIPSFRVHPVSHDFLCLQTIAWLAVLGIACCMHCFGKREERK